MYITEHEDIQMYARKLQQRKVITALNWFFFSQLEVVIYNRIGLLVVMYVVIVSVLLLFIFPVDGGGEVPVHLFRLFVSIQ